MVKAGAKYADTNGLLHVLPAALELFYAVTVNINTTDGLINGAPCTLKKIQYLNQAICTNPTYRPNILWVLFEDSQIGQQWRQRYRHFLHHRNRTVMDTNIQYRKEFFCTQWQSVM